MKTKNKKQKIVKMLMFISLFLIMNPQETLASEISKEKILELTNKSRIEAGLKGLVTNEKLALVAKAKAMDMLENQYFEHTSPTGVTPWFWFEKMDYDYIYAAENLAIDFKTANGVHKAFMKSTGHRENILGVNYNEIGIAVVKGYFEGKETTLVVEAFGSRENEIVDGKIFFEESKGFESINMENDMILDDREAEEICDKCGLVLPRVFSIKNPVTLKSTYVINIYWEDSKDNDEIISSSSYKIKIINLLSKLEKDMININF